MSNKNSKPQNKGLGLIIFLIVVFGNSFRAIFNGIGSYANVTASVIFSIVISLLIPLMIFIFVFRVIRKRNKGVSYDEPAENYYTKDNASKNNDMARNASRNATRIRIANRNNDEASSSKKESFYSRETRKSDASEYSINAKNVKDANRIRNANKRKYADRANEKIYVSKPVVVNNMPTEPFPCRNCGTMLQPGTLFCYNCDTKVDYSRFDK